MWKIQETKEDLEEGREVMKSMEMEEEAQEDQDQGTEKRLKTEEFEEGS